MANSGGPVFDMTFRVASANATTTAQFSVVCGGTNSSTFAPSIPTTTTSYSYPVGVIQNRMTANSTAVTVRMGGVSKVQLLDSITAFQYLKVAASGTCGQFTLSATQNTVTTANQIYVGVIGKALEDGATGQVIEALISPQLMFGQGT